MQRCLYLAIKGAGSVAPNPMVGAVLVYEDDIIGEGWHQEYGEAHAEVNCINNAMKCLRLNAESGRKHKMNGPSVIEKSTLYVSLEPCAHFGKTPPCADLIIQHKIPKVVIGCRDPFPEVNGKGIEKLKAAGVEVDLASGEMESECKELNKRFFTFHESKRPFVILKWAETGDGKIAAPLNLPAGETLNSADSRLLISNEYSNRLVHQWRSEEGGILVGTNTALLDDPELTTRLWEGRSPVRLVLDMNLRLPTSLKVFNKEVKTIIFNSFKHKEEENLIYYKLKKDEKLVKQMMNALYELKIQSVMIEGGAKLLQTFIDEGIWDEARVIKNEKLIINNGLDAPVLIDAVKITEQIFLSDKIEISINNRIC